MRVRKGQKYTKFSARIAKDDNERFNDLLPHHGARMWFIRTALDSFLAYAREHKEAIGEIETEIRNQVATQFQAEEPLGGVEFTAHVLSDAYNEFNTLLPVYGATSWLLRGAVKRFINQSQGEVLPAKRIQDAVIFICDRANAA